VWYGGMSTRAGFRATLPCTQLRAAATPAAADAVPLDIKDPGRETPCRRVLMRPRTTHCQHPPPGMIPGLGLGGAGAVSHLKGILTELNPSSFIL
jgi:hypothetical protein